MPWTPSTALVPSLQTLQEPRVTTAEVSIYTADVSLMRQVPSAPTARLECLGKADNYMASKRESYLNCIFRMCNPCSPPKMMTSLALELGRGEHKAECAAENCATRISPTPLLSI